jgi:hypothetical protein
MICLVALLINKLVYNLVVITQNVQTMLCEILKLVELGVCLLFVIDTFYINVPLLANLLTK